ncbi:MAG: hypothetical protein NTAFB01_43330 [Nitrospira sp.]
MYEQVFRNGRLKADSRLIMLCYKVQFNLRKFTQEMIQKGQNKYAFVGKSRYLLWSLLCQGILNNPQVEEFAERHGTSMAMPLEYKEYLSRLAITRVRVLLSELMEAKEYEDKVREQNLSFLRTDRAFEKCMEIAYKRWRWVHKNLDDGRGKAGPEQNKSWKSFKPTVLEMIPIQWFKPVGSVTHCRLLNAAGLPVQRPAGHQPIRTTSSPASNPARRCAHAAPGLRGLRRA